MVEQKEIKADVKVIAEAKLVEVPTQYTPAIQLEDGSVIDERELLVRMYNKINAINKTLNGK